MRNEELNAGQDSFLDIVANLVGILIILVVVVGAQAQSVWTKQAAKPEDSKKVEQLQADVDASKAKEKLLDADNVRMEAQIKEELIEIKKLENYRHNVLVQLELAKERIEQQKQELDASAREKFERQAELSALQQELNDAQEELQAVSADVQPKQETIRHYPTPIAKTVFMDEVHFQLKDNRLSFVPLEELLDRMKAEWRVKAEKLKQVRNTIETIPEIEGFRMQYELASVTETQNTEFGRLSRDVIQFRQFVLIPTGAMEGEPVGSALQEGSAFYSRLAGKTPRTTTVSVWVYPESYGSFNDVKEWLHKRGYQTAAWPLSEGSLISGSPDGLRTSAQ